MDEAQWESFHQELTGVRSDLREVIDTLRGTGSKMGLVGDVRALESVSERHSNDLANHEKYIKQLEASRFRLKGATIMVVGLWTVLTPFLVVLLEHLLK
jgi:hypothetical protein